MTPVQLPEVPAPAGFLLFHHHMGVNQVHGYTAAQLHEYATKAVMAERRLLMLRVAAWRSEAKQLEQSRHEGALDYHDALINCADDIEPLLRTPTGAQQ